MTAADAKQWRILGAIAIPLLIALLVGAWASKESVGDHNRDIDRLSGNVQRILDVLCIDKPTARACKGNP